MRPWESKLRGRVGGCVGVCGRPCSLRLSERPCQRLLEAMGGHGRPCERLN